MPRNGSGVYSHPFPDVVEGTTIESAVFNGNTSDVEQDLNTPRPIIAGGTGANNARDAMIALSGEIAKQGPVTNYDTFPFVNGSFFSDNGATSAPTGSTFTGIYYEHPNPAFATVEAREYVTGVQYVRQKISGVWGAWKQQPGSSVDLDAAYVNISGDAMTGSLSVYNASAFGWPLIVRAKADVNIGFTGGNGATAQFGALNDAGNTWMPIQIPSTIQCSAEVITGSSTPSGTIRFGNLSNRYLTYDGTNFTFSGGAVKAQSYIANAEITAGGGGATGTYYFGNSGSKFLTCDGASYTFAGTAGYLGTQQSSFYLSSSNGAAGTPGTFNFNGSGTKYLQYDGAGYTLAGGPLFISVSLTLQPPATYVVSYNGTAKISFNSATQFGIALRGNGDGTAIIFEGPSSGIAGSIYVSTSATAYNTTSSGELKEDLKSFDAGSIIDQTNVYDFKWKNADERAYGVIAQQAIEVYPTAVTHSKMHLTAEGKEAGADDDYWGVDYSKYVPVILQELKALRARVRELEGKPEIGGKPQ